jgi:predicted  nucleic acid-binding Zn-ribbon protein
MSGPGDIIRELHRLRRHAKELQEQIDRGPRVAQAQQIKVTRQEEALKQAQEEIKHLKVQSHEKEVTLKATHAQIAKYEKQRNETTMKKEYDALQAEIASAKRRSQQNEDDILETMGAVEEASARIPELEKALQRAKDEAVEFARKTQERLGGQKEQLQAVQQQIKELEATLPEEVRVAYDRLMGSRGEDGLSAVQDRNCVACYTTITAQSYNDLLSGRLVSCNVCGRMLYLPE